MDPSGISDKAHVRSVDIILGFMRNLHNAPTERLEVSEKLTFPIKTLHKSAEIASTGHRRRLLPSIGLMIHVNAAAMHPVPRCRQDFTTNHARQVDQENARPPRYNSQQNTPFLPYIPGRSRPSLSGLPSSTMNPTS